MKTIKCLLVIIVSIGLSNVKGQEFNPLTLSLNYLHNSSENKPLTVNSNFTINLPVYRDSSFTFLTGSSFKLFKVNLPDDTMNINNLYSLSVPVTLVYKVSSGKMITFLFEPAIGADFNGLSHKNFRFNSALVYRVSNENRSTWGVGVAATKRFSGFLIVPILVFNIRYSDKWLLSGSFPLKQNLSYNIDNKRKIGINLGAGNNSFRLSEAKGNSYVNTQQFGAGCFYQQLVARHFKMELSMGIQSYRTFVYEENQSSPITIFPLNFNKSKNEIESFKNKGVLLQLSLLYTVF
jgi:hypothetical protein